jgi:uncharacterized membrane protein
MLTLLLLCLLLGCVAGLRSLTPPAAVCWGAHMGWLHLSGKKLAFLGHPTALIIFTLLALFELVNDKLPKTPSRTALPGLIARILTGGFSAAALAVSAGGSVVVAALVGIIGALAGTFGGYNVRHSLVSSVHLPDLPVALVEDVIAVAGGLLIVSHL